MLLIAGAVQAQERRTEDFRRRQALIDSIANPQKAEGAAAMRFERTTIDAGTMNEDDAPRSYTFRWRNDGAQPLVITHVRTTCGCTRATFDRKPVGAGEESQIGITYLPKGHVGGFERKIYVYTQLSDRYPTATLTLACRVTPSLSPTADYPLRMGALLLRRNEVRIAGDVRQVERIACMNGGGVSLNVEANRELLPAGLTVEMERRPLSAGEECDLVFRFDPAKVNGKLPQSVPVVLEIAEEELPPSRRTVKVIFGKE